MDISKQPGILMAHHGCLGHSLSGFWVPAGLGTDSAVSSTDRLGWGRAGLASLNLPPFLGHSPNFVHYGMFFCINIFAKKSFFFKLH